MTPKFLHFNPLTFLVTLSSIRCLTLFLTFLEFSFFQILYMIFIFFSITGLVCLSPLVNLS